MQSAFDAFVERGRKDLRLQSLHGVQCPEEPLFDAEVALIRRLNCEDALVQAANYGEQLRQKGLYFHTIGSGCSSLVLFVLGMSNVNPIDHGTYFQRFWQTSSGRPPILQLVVDSIGKPGLRDITLPDYVTAHSMTEVEAIPNRVESLIGTIATTKMDQATLATLRAGRTDHVFQFRSGRAKWLLDQIQPANIEELCVVTALEQLSYSHPNVVISFLESKRRDIHKSRWATGGRAPAEAQCQHPVLFQELLMSQLRHLANLPWNDTYPFIRESAKRRGDDRLECWRTALGLTNDLAPEDAEKLLRSIAESSRWAVCRAHHTANALTSYKAAYCLTHHRVEFETIHMQITKSACQGKES